MISKDPGLWNSGMLGGATSASSGVASLNNRSATTLGGGASTPVATSGNNSYAFMASASPSVLMQGGTNGLGGNPSGLIPATLGHERSQELCKYFLNGGCLRGVKCTYLHELPDERHLDVNGYGYILNPNVHNAQKTVPLAVNSATTSTVQVNGGAPTSSPVMLGLSSSNSRQPHGAKGMPQATLMVGVPTHLTFQPSAPAVKAPPPKYRPPEPFLEYNLPPTLALPFSTSGKDLAFQLTRTMLQN